MHAHRRSRRKVDREIARTAADDPERARGIAQKLDGLALLLEQATANISSPMTCFMTTLPGPDFGSFATRFGFRASTS